MKTCSLDHYNLGYYLKAFALNLFPIAAVMGAHHESYKVVHGWPQLPENDALGEDGVVYVVDVHHGMRV